MSFLRTRFPSRAEVWLAFAVTAFPVHFWAMLAYLREVPSYLLRLGLGEIFGILAYILGFALCETLLLLAGILILAGLLPRGWLLDRFVPQATILAWIPMLWTIPIHYQERLMQVLPFPNPRLYFWIWLATLLLAVLDLTLAFRRQPRLERGLCSFADRLTVLGGVYLLFDLAAIAFVILRNL